ncbi:uncharacterized protein EI97DRAFT_456518 [Westerdykella ornata]|uniref:Nucleotide-diphospho-sugar transferase domain-containing protein n=1 Tax=Westerdykella ornata TaxID=318751 RepID=A0A6A6JSN3_WESOR|nr:uncharacterized protein EI97DRAFT_456518 [Westerdykella ornata]KAF2279123.1 hypothetical protein EI97DRAFT_456518 [Westerdykella ornata]
MLLDRQIPSLNPRFAIFFACGVALLLFAIYHITLYTEHGPFYKGNVGSRVGSHAPASEPKTAVSQPNQPKPKPTLEETIRELFAPIKHKDFVSSFTDPTGTVYTHNNNIWTEPLGKDLLIVDVDTRYPEQMFDPSKRVDWEHLDTDNLVTEAVFNHYLYATIHNYSYLFYRPIPVPGHHKTWPKVHSISNLLPQYKFVVFLDADATIRHLHLPFEWLLNRWNVTRRTSFTMARDPLDDDCNLCDKYGTAMVNTGFVIAQNLPYTREIMDVWMACTAGGTRYGAECGKWKEEWAHEQSVFSDYLRYDYNPEGDNIRELNCGEANGFPGHGWYDPVDCNGKFIRHHTFVKDRTKTTTSEAIMQAFIDIMKTNFAKVGGDIVVSEEKEKKKATPKPEVKQEEDKEGEKAHEQAHNRRSAIWHEPLKRSEVS